MAGRSASWPCFTHAAVVPDAGARVLGLALHAVASGAQPHSGVSGTSQDDEFLAEALPTEEDADLRTDHAVLYVGLEGGLLHAFQVLAEDNGSAPSAAAAQNSVDGVSLWRVAEHKLAEECVRHLCVVQRWNSLLCVADGRLVTISLDDPTQLGPSLTKLEHVLKQAAVELNGGELPTVHSFAVNPDANLLCAVCTKALIIVAWQAREFVLHKAVPTRETVREVRWAGPSRLCIGYAKDYAFMEVDTADELKLPRIWTGVRKEPILCNVRLGRQADTVPSQTAREDDGELLLCKDREAFFISFDGHPTRKGRPVSSAPSTTGAESKPTENFISFSDQPLAVLACQPFILGLLPRQIEVFLADTCKIVQTLKIKACTLGVTNGELLACSPTLIGPLASMRRGLVFLASDRTVELLSMNPLLQLIQELLDAEVQREPVFETALDFCRAACDRPWGWRVPQNDATGSRHASLFVGAGLVSEDLDILRATVHARAALFQFTEAAATPCFNSAYSHLKSAMALGWLPLEFVVALFKRTQLFLSEQAAMDCAKTLTRLRGDLAAELGVDDDNEEDLLQRGPPILALYRQEDLVELELVDVAEDLAFFDGQTLSDALSLVFIPYILSFRDALVLHARERMSDLSREGSDHPATALLEVIDALLLQSFVLCESLTGIASTSPGAPKPRPVSSIEMRARSALITKQKMEFLRGENWCEVRAAEKLLLSYPEMWEDLLWLYHGKGLHDKALEWLHSLERNARPGSGLQVPPRSLRASSSPYLSKAIEYMRSIWVTEQDLVKKHAAWVVRDCSVLDSVSVFFGPDCGLVPMKRQLSTLDYLEKLDRSHLGVTSGSSPLPADFRPASVTFGERLVGELPQTADRKQLKTRLATLYVDMILLLRQDAVSVAEAELHGKQTKSDEKRAPAAQIERLRGDLAHLLQTSDQYEANNVALRLQATDLFAEFTVVLGRLGRHDDALRIYVDQLDDIAQAEAYCRQVYDSADPSRREVYIKLVRALVAKDRMDKALAVLQSHATEVNPVQLLESLPGDLALCKIRPFLDAALQFVASEASNAQVVKNLARKECLVARRSLLDLKNTAMIIDEQTRCAICRDAVMAGQACARLPNGQVVHSGCLVSHSVIPSN